MSHHPDTFRDRVLVSVLEDKSRALAGFEPEASDSLSLISHRIGTKEGMRKLDSNNDVSCEGIARKILKKINGFGNASLINSENVNVTSLKLAVKFDNTFSHLFLFGNIFTQGHGFDAVTVTSSKKCSLPSLTR